MKTRRKSITAGELIAELKADPVFQEQERELERKFNAIYDEIERAEAPLVADLRAAGADVSTVWDLVNTTAPYPSLLPILHRHLDRPYPERVREGILRAMAVRGSRQFWDDLVRRYETESDQTTHGVKWALHLAIAAAADVSVVDDLIRLATDRRHGRNRALFVDALARLNDPRATSTLAQLESDQDLCGDVARVLKKRKRRPSR